MLPVFPVNFKSPQTHFPVKSPQIPANICSVPMPNFKLDAHLVVLEK